MDDSFDEDPINEFLIPEIAMNVEDTPVELNDDPVEPDKSQPSEEQNGEVIEPGGTDGEINNTSDDVIPFVVDTNQENENPAQIPEIYTLEEVAVYQQIFGPGQQAVQFLRMHCTACNEHLGSAPNMQHKRYIHPLLKVLICKRCYDFYGSGDFDKDEDGSELYCRWCGQGGKVLCCAQCPYVFCQRCIRVNLGKKALDVVKESDDWTCFACKPLQIINLRITCRALYDYVQEEMRLAAELKQPERLTADNSLCCHGKPKVAVAKRKRSDSAEIPYDPVLDNDDITYRKKKKMKHNILSHMSAVASENILPIADNSKAWESNVQDEVVCTPDLPILMDDDDTSVRTPTPNSPQPSCSTSPYSSSLLQPPPLRPISPFENGVNSKKDSEVQYIGQTKIISNNFSMIKPKKTYIKTNLGYKLTNVPVVLNTSTNKPLTSNSITPNLVHLQAPAVKYTMGKDQTVHQPVVTVAHNRNNSVIDATPARLAPGLRYEWFEKAAQVTARVNQNLSTRLCTLSKEQTTVSSLEGLAGIHNNLQEILSNSINSLMQIRKNLRSDFIAGLKKLKFCKSDKNISQNKQQLSDDNDVIIVDSHTPVADPVPNSFDVSNENKRGYLKVKPVSELLDSAVITIPDDNVTNNDVTPFIGSCSSPINEIIEGRNSVITTTSDNGSDEALNEQIQDKEKEPNNYDDDVDDNNKKEKSASNNVNNNTNDELSEMETETLNPETVSLIKRAVLESKFEALVNDNLKFKTIDNISPQLLKSMLNVRVVVETNFGSQTPITRPRKGYKAMKIDNYIEQDIEQMLSSSIVLNTSKRKAFDDSFSAFVANRKQTDESPNESNDDDDDDDDEVRDPSQTTNINEEINNKHDDSGEANLPPETISENEETSQDPRTTDSGIDVDGEQSLSNGDKNYGDNE